MQSDHSEKIPEREGYFERSYYAYHPYKSLKASQSHLPISSSREVYTK